jgi:hypothetical protein
MTVFGVFLLALGLAAGVSLTGYGVLRMLLGNYLDASLAVMWESVMSVPYRPLTARGILLGLTASLVCCTIGLLLLRPERKSEIRRIVLTNEPPQPPAA